MSVVNATISISKYLYIAVSYGTYNDPFTCSAYDSKDEVKNYDGADECRAWICKQKNLELWEVDAVLVVGPIFDYYAGTENGLAKLEVVRNHQDNLSYIKSPSLSLKFAGYKDD